MIKMERHSTPEDVLSLKNTRIFIVGDIILDTYIEGKVSRISPEAPVPVVLEFFEGLVELPTPVPFF